VRSIPACVSIISGD